MPVHAVLVGIAGVACRPRGKLNQALAGRPVRLAQRALPSVSAPSLSGPL